MRTYPGARLHARLGEQKGTFTVDLSENYRLCFSPAEPFLLKKDGGIDNKSVIAIVMTGIDDPH